MCGCEQGTCLGNCPCGCEHTPPAKVIDRKLVLASIQPVLDELGIDVNVVESVHLDFAHVTVQLAPHLAATSSYTVEVPIVDIEATP